jgi:hypothetical protein
VAVSFIGGGNRCTRRNPPICRKSLTNFITKCFIEYISPWMGFKLTFVVIGTDCTCSCNPTTIRSRPPRPSVVYGTIPSNIMVWIGVFFFATCHQRPLRKLSFTCKECDILHIMDTQFGLVIREIFKIWFARTNSRCHFWRVCTSQMRNYAHIPASTHKGHTLLQRWMTT